MNKYVEGQVLRHKNSTAQVAVKEVNPCDEINMYRLLSCGGVDLTLANGLYWFTQKTVEEDFTLDVAPKFKKGDKIRRIADGKEFEVLRVDTSDLEDTYLLTKCDYWIAQDIIEEDFELVPAPESYETLVQQVKELKAEYKAYKAHFTNVQTKLFEKEEALRRAQDELDNKVAKDCE